MDGVEERRPVLLLPLGGACQMLALDLKEEKVEEEWQSHDVAVFAFFRLF